MVLEVLDLFFFSLQHFRRALLDSIEILLAEFSMRSASVFRKPVKVLLPGFIPNVSRTSALQADPTLN